MNIHEGNVQICGLYFNPDKTHKQYTLTFFHIGPQTTFWESGAQLLCKGKSCLK